MGNITNTSILCRKNNVSFNFKLVAISKATQMITASSFIFLNMKSQNGCINNDVMQSGFSCAKNKLICDMQPNLPRGMCLMCETTEWGTVCQFESKM